MPEELWTEVHDTVQEAVIKIIPKKRNGKKSNWLPEEVFKKLRKEKLKAREKRKDIPI